MRSSAFSRTCGSGETCSRSPCSAVQYVNARAAFRERLHVHQHAADIRVHDDRIGRLIQRLCAGDRTALHALTRKNPLRSGKQTSACARPCMPTPSRASFIMTNMVRMPLVRLADEIARRAVIVHHARRVAVDAHLLFKAATLEGVARAQRAIGLHHELRHDEQRDAFDAFRPAFDARQHQLNDVLREVLLAAGKSRSSGR